MRHEYILGTNTEVDYLRNRLGSHLNTVAYSDENIRHNILTDISDVILAYDNIALPYSSHREYGTSDIAM